MLMQRNAHTAEPALPNIHVHIYEMEIVDDAMWKRQREYTTPKMFSYHCFVFPHFGVCVAVSVSVCVFVFGSLLLASFSRTHANTQTHKRNGFFSQWEYLSVLRHGKESLYSWWKLSTYTHTHKMWEHLCVYACVFGEYCLWCLWHSHEERVLFKLCWEIARVR